MAKSFVKGHLPMGNHDSDSSSTQRSDPREPRQKSKVPRGWRDKVTKSLPSYAGPYSVGVMEIEVPAESPRSFSTHPAYKDLLQLETVLMCVYYPSAIGSGHGDDGSGKKGWSRQTWLPRPRKTIAEGYAKFGGIPSWLAETWFATTTMPTKLPAFRNAPLAEHWAPNATAKEAGLKVKSEVGKPPAGFEKDEMPTFPLIMFSHGLGGTRTAYSTLCGEFASFGFLVCAVEHRDGSAPRTCILRKHESSEVEEGKDGFDPTNEDAPRWIDYIFPEENPFDTSPVNEKGVDLELRDAQLQMRKAEIAEAYQVMCRIRNGDGNEVGSQNLRRRGHAGSSSRGLEGVDWSKWKDRFHLEQVTMVGHSFGAATTVEVLRNRRKEFPFITQGIIYDIWGAPLRPPSADDHSQKLDCPLLGINSEAFMYWEDNFTMAMSLVKESALYSTSGPTENSETPHPRREPDAHHHSYLLTVPGTVHISQSDFPLLYPHIVSTVMHSTMEPHRAIEINIRASLEFLQRVLPERISAVERASKSAGLLDAEILDEMPTQGKPLRPNHLALRIRRPNRFVASIKQHLEPLLKNQWNKEESHSIDISKRDIWVHFAPGKPDEGGKPEDQAHGDLQDSNSTKNDQNHDDTNTTSNNEMAQDADDGGNSKPESTSNPNNYETRYNDSAAKTESGTASSKDKSPIINPAGSLKHLERGGHA